MLAKGSALVLAVALLSGCYFGPGEELEPQPYERPAPPTEDDVEAALAAFVSIPGAYKIEASPDPFTGHSRDLHGWLVYHVDAARTRVHAESELSYDCKTFGFLDCKERPIGLVWEIGGTLRWEVEADGAARAYRDHLPGAVDWLFRDRSFELSGFEPEDGQVRGNTSDGLPFTASVSTRSHPVRVSSLELDPPGSDAIRFFEGAQPDDETPPKMASVKRMPFAPRLDWGTNNSIETLEGLDGAVPPQELQVSCLDRDGVAHSSGLVSEGFQTPECSFEWTDEGDGLVGNGDQVTFTIPWGWELGVTDLWAD